MAKLTFDEALERINDGRIVKRDEVRADALRRFVWVASNGMPGCLNDNSSICVSKYDAIESVLDMWSEGAPRGMVTALRAPGDYCAFDDNGYLYRVEKMRFSGLF